MKKFSLRKKRQGFYIAKFGREIVAVYQRRTPNGGIAFMVANYAKGKRRFDCYSQEAAAIEAANRLVKQMSARHTTAAGFTEGQAIDYTDAKTSLEPFGVDVRSAYCPRTRTMRIHAASR